MKIKSIQTIFMYREDQLYTHTLEKLEIESLILFLGNIKGLV